MTETTPTPTRIALAFLAVYLVWGSTYLAIRFAVETLPPFLMAGVRYGTAGALMYGWLRFRGAPAPTARQWGAAAIAGGTMLLVGNGLVSWAEQFVPSGLTALIVATVPIWFVTIAWLGPDRDRPSLSEAGGVLLGLAGVGLLMSGSLGEIGLHGATASQVLWGAIALLVASVAWAIGSIYSRRAPLARPTLYATAMTMVAGGILLTLAGIGLGELGRFDPAGVSTRSLLALAYLIVFGSIVAFSCYAWLIRVVRPALAGTYAYVNPIVAVLLGWGLADEAITREMAIGATLIIGAIFLVDRSRARARRRERAAGDATPIGAGRASHQGSSATS